MVDDAARPSSRYLNHRCSVSRSAWCDSRRHETQVFGSARGIKCRQPNLYAPPCTGRGSPMPLFRMSPGRLRIAILSDQGT